MVAIAIKAKASGSNHFLSPPDKEFIDTFDAFAIRKNLYVTSYERRVPIPGSIVITPQFSNLNFY
jgi:hypothetical protein